MKVLLFDAPQGAHAAVADALRAEGATVEVDVHTDRGHMRGVRARVLAAQPRVVLVLSAWDDPLGCESDPERAFARNAEDLIHVAAAALEAKAVPVLVSPAEVYGQSGGPFGEDEAPVASCVWTTTRLRGEVLLRRAAPRALVLRAGPLAVRHGPPWGALAIADGGLADPVAPADLAHAVVVLVRAERSGTFHVGHPDPADTRPTRKALASALGVPVLTPAPGAPRVRLGRAPVLLAEKLRLDRRRAPVAWRDLDLTPPAARPEVTRMGHRQDVRRVEKPWGYEVIWAVAERYVGKLLFIRAGERLSLQYHQVKDETIYVLSGKMVFEVGPLEPAGTPREDLVLKPGDAYRITPHTVHRMIALEDTQVLEASTPELDDVVRLEDKYGRQGTSKP